MLVEISHEQAACLEEYSRETGRSFEECVEEALYDWIQVVASTIYQNEKSNVLAFIR
jgi:hypothetical protein